VEKKQQQRHLEYILLDKKKQKPNLKKNKGRSSERKKGIR
jgi:hypothetical protein